MVSQYLVRNNPFVVALNGLDLQAGIIKNAYLAPPCNEKFCTRAETELGIDEGKVYIVLSTLYSLKSYGAEFREFFAEILDEIGFIFIVVDPDAWYREAMDSECDEYYEYILVYVGDLIGILLDL